MKNKETGEFELVVGNAQLLSGFFIVVLLFAVAFAMGYIVARAKYQQEPSLTVAASGSRTALDARPAAAAQSTLPAPQQDTQGPPAQAAGQPNQPAQKPPEEATAGTQPAREGAGEAPRPADGGAASGDAPAGSYWQVSATVNQDSARALLQTIKDMGLPVTLSPGPNNMTRVLVGPYHDTSAMAKVKTQLENAGLHPLRHSQ